MPNREKLGCVNSTLWADAGSRNLGFIFLTHLYCPLRSHGGGRKKALESASDISRNLPDNSYITSGCMLGGPLLFIPIVNKERWRKPRRGIREGERGINPVICEPRPTHSLSRLLCVAKFAGLRLPVRCLLPYSSTHCMLSPLQPKAGPTQHLKVLTPAFKNLQHRVLLPSFFPDVVTVTFLGHRDSREECGPH